MPSGYMHRPLSDFIGLSPSVEIVEYPSQHTPEQIRNALTEIMPLLRPYPALRIADWFWETLAGKQVSQSQWMAYEDEAITPSAASRMIWGLDTKPRLIALQGLIIRGEIHNYRRPNNTLLGTQGKPGHPPRPFYLRRSEVEAYARKAEVLAAEREQRIQTKRDWMKQQEAARRVAMERVS
jgi:hypothetical protein